MQATVVGEGMDSGDKAANKAMAIAHKYALLQTFCIPTEEQKDPDAETHDVLPKQRQQVPQNQAAKQPAVPINEDQAMEIATAIDELFGAGKEAFEYTRKITGYYKVASLLELTEPQYRQVMAQIDENKNKRSL